VPITWYVLQGWPGLAERPSGFGIVAGEHDVHELACVMRALDLVITVDSLAAHLAGALPVPVWTLPQAGCDWRWMIDRDDSPWYPTMRLFRQGREGDWDDVAARVARELEARMTEHHVR
jgi:ADP-heptose:LPS heptosyltransferase